MRVLIAEDDLELAKGLKYLLEKQKISVDVVHNGMDALDSYHSFQYDVVVLDIAKREMDSLSVLREIRKMKTATLVMILSAKAEIEDKVTGFEMGADDYLTKPFAPKEFVVRVKALCRRKIGEYNDGILSFGRVRLDCNRYMLSCGSREVRLINKEFQLFELFFRYPRMVFSTQNLMDKIWGMDSVSGTDVVWTYIGFLRKKLKSIGADVEIKTIRGVGYSFEEKKIKER